jgi:hypothetical protein
MADASMSHPCLKAPEPEHTLGCYVYGCRNINCGRRKLIEMRLNSFDAAASSKDAVAHRRQAPKGTWK